MLYFRIINEIGIEIRLDLFKIIVMEGQRAKIRFILMERNKLYLRGIEDSYNIIGIL